MLSRRSLGWLRYLHPKAIWRHRGAIMGATFTRAVMAMVVTTLSLRRAATPPPAGGCKPENWTAGGRR